MDKTEQIFVEEYMDYEIYKIIEHKWCDDEEHPMKKIFYTSIKKTSMKQSITLLVCGIGALVSLLAAISLNGVFSALSFAAFLILVLGMMKSINFVVEGYDSGTLQGLKKRIKYEEGIDND